MLSFSQVKSAGSAGNYYTEKDNYYVIGSMEERWQGKGAEALGLEGKVDKQIFTELLQGKLPYGSDLTRIQDGVNKPPPPSLSLSEVIPSTYCGRPRAFQS